jgi:hypothetical protein
VLASTISGFNRDKSVVMYIPIWKYMPTEVVWCVALKADKWPEKLAILPNQPGIFK